MAGSDAARWICNVSGGVNSAPDDAVAWDADPAAQSGRLKVCHSTIWRRSLAPPPRPVAVGPRRTFLSCLA